MRPQVQVQVDPKGRMRVEYVGFLGEDCFEEAERLQERLKALGLSLEVTERVIKSAAQMQREVGTTTERRVKCDEVPGS